MLTKFLTALNKKDALLFNEKPLTISLNNHRFINVHERQ